MNKKVKLWNKLPHEDEQLLLGRMAEILTFYLQHSQDSDLTDAIKLHHSDYLVGPYKELPPGFYSQLDALLAKIAEKRELTEFPTAACLCIQADESSVLFKWHGLVISTALEHLRLFSDPSRVASAVNAYRLFVSLEQKKHNSEINKNVPSASLALPEIVKAINTYFEQPDVIKATRWDANNGGNSPLLARDGAYTKNLFSATHTNLSAPQPPPLSDELIRKNEHISMQRFVNQRNIYAKNSQNIQMERLCL